MTTATKPPAAAPAPYLSATDQILIQQIIRQEVDASGEGWLVPDSAVLVLSQAIVAKVNSVHTGTKK